MQQWVKPRPRHKKTFRKLYEKNYSVVARRWPHIAKLLDTLKPKLKHEVLFDPILGRPNLRVFAGDRAVMLHSPDPLLEAEQKVKSPEFRYPQFLIFLGLGLGFYPLVFKKLKGKFIKVMLIVEKYPEILKAAMHLVDLTPIFADPRVELMVGVPEDKLFPYLRKYMEFGTRKWFFKVVKFVVHEPSFALDKQYYKRVVSSTRDAIREALIFFGNDPQDSLIGLDNIVKNIEHIIFNPGVKDLYGKFRGKPAICVASGPSLAKNAHLLRQVQDKALIFCCDATLKPLLYRYGVRPHIVSSLERVPAVVKFFEGIEPDLLRDTWLGACPVVVPEVYETYGGPKIVVYRDFAHFRWLGIDRGILRIGPSCANMSFKVAEALGCNPIILVGQDLAFAETGESHVEGHVFGTQNVKLPQNAIWVRGNYAEKVATTRAWYMFLKHFELDIADYKGICINATEGGAYIEGTKVMKLADAIEEFVREPIYPVEVIREHLREPSVEEVRETVSSFKERLKETKEFMDDVMESYRSKLEEVMAFNREVLPPILSRTEDYLEDEEVERAKTLYNEIMKLKVETMGQELFYLYPMHVVQPYVINSEVELTAIFEKYNDYRFAYVEWVAKHQEWFRVMLGLLRECYVRLDWIDERIQQIEKKLNALVE